MLCHILNTTMVSISIILFSKYKARFSLTYKIIPQKQGNPYYRTSESLSEYRKFLLCVLKKKCAIWKRCVNLKQSQSKILF